MQRNSCLWSRRDVLRAVAGTSLALSPTLVALAADPKRLFKIGVHDGSIRLRGQVGSLEFAKTVGIDGVQVNFGPPGEGDDLRVEAVRQRFLDASVTYGVEIASLGLGSLNQIPYASDPRAEKWVQECIEIMPKLRQRIVLVPFFHNGDIKGKPELHDAVIRRLKRVAPQAEAAGVVLGLESWLCADDHLRILDAVDSPAIQVYYDVANMEKQGYDLYQEIRQLGSKRICQIHCKENGFLLGQGRIDFVKVKEAIDEIGWTGWLVIEGACRPGMQIKDCYVQNQKFLRSIFPTGV